MKKKLKAIGKGVYFALWATVFAMVVLCACTNKNKPICGYIVGKQFVPHHAINSYNVILQQTTTTIYPDMWFLYVADSVKVHKIRVEEEDFDNARKGEFARYKTDGSTTD